MIMMMMMMILVVVKMMMIHNNNIDNGEGGGVLPAYKGGVGKENLKAEEGACGWWGLKLQTARAEGSML